MRTAGQAPLHDEEGEPLALLDRELSRLFDEHAAFVWRVLERLGTPPAELDDALQEVFLVVARKLPSYEERGGIKAWLFTIARQVAAHSRRATLRRAQRERTHEALPSSDEDPHAALERSQALRFVQTFLSSLDTRQATVFYLAEIEGMTAPEIAGCLSVGVNTVYGRLRLAREQFERALRRRSGR